ncbi:ATP-binding protein [Mesobacillus subterraneus]|uniref:histidine kinase n=1 Tax=Mesobacillus subterraneus TaxID=285983 RepID=A0A427TYQ6_9BACI|nr:ATP-binding protein [Mesobacillus subterraneus]RSD29582.1 GHKL domain-containing protein [Mesobacillus subterraneus]
MVDQRVKVDYEQFIPRETGFIFKFIKKDNRFIHTFIEGKLIEKVGLCPEYIIGKSLFEFLPADQAMRKESFYEKAWNGEHVNYEGSFAEIQYLAILSPIRLNGETVEVIGTTIDITKEKTREKQVQQMEKLSVVGELAAGIAHEIRNPLTSLKGFAKIVKESVTEPALVPYLDIMLDEMDRINEIVNEFMFIAKPNENVNFQYTNYTKLLRDCIHFMEPQALLKGIEIQFSSDAEIILNCDRNQMKQVLINLLQNAIEATEYRGHCIGVRLDEVSNETVMVTIADKGCGISEARFERLFEPFYSTKEKGTGLGLITCKRIIDLHQGHIDVKSKLGEGTTIRILLPRYYPVETLLAAE